MNRVPSKNTAMRREGLHFNLRVVPALEVTDKQETTNWSKSLGEIAQSHCSTCCKRLFSEQTTSFNKCSNKIRALGPQNGWLLWCH